MRNKTTLLAFCAGIVFLGLFYVPVFANQPRLIKHSGFLANQSNLDGTFIYLPIVMKPLPTPTLNPINNSDVNNLYAVSWNPAAGATSYVLQESTDENFVSSSNYPTSGISWTTPAPGKSPAKYYYRLASVGAVGNSGWSNVQSITIFPLYVGLRIRWDGMGYIRGSEYYDIGYHETDIFNTLTDIDTIRGDGTQWYDPNPKNFISSTWSLYYSPSTGDYKSGSETPDPSWKWGNSWKLPYIAQFTSGTTTLIDGQKFSVTGPVDGYTTFGTPIKYWQFVNQEKFLYWDGSGDWKQYIHAGDITLRYDAGNSRLLLYENIMRRQYYQGGITSNTVQYIKSLTSASSIPGSPTFVSPAFDMEPKDSSRSGVNDINRMNKAPILK
jgi:hypothetical protein